MTPHDNTAPSRAAGQPDEAKVEQRHYQLANACFGDLYPKLAPTNKWLIEAAQKCANFEAEATKELRAQLEAAKTFSKEMQYQWEKTSAQLAAAEAERDALAKKLSDQSMSVIIGVDEFDAIEAKATRCEAAEAILESNLRERENLRADLAASEAALAEARADRHELRELLNLAWSFPDCPAEGCGLDDTPETWRAQEEWREDYQKIDEKVRAAIDAAASAKREG